MNNHSTTGINSNAIIAMKENKFLETIHLLAGVFAANCFIFVHKMPILWLVSILSFVIANLLPCTFVKNWPSRKLKNCYHGTKMLQMFQTSTLISIVMGIAVIVKLWDDGFLVWWPALVIPFVAESVYFWNGMISVYLSSEQLGIRYRSIGLLVGMIPIVHLFMLSKIIRVTKNEVITEYVKNELNNSREMARICETKYPILMVHGVFFRDFENFNYWGRIPQELTRNGATIYYGNHSSAASVPDSAKELLARVQEIVHQTGCGKVNIIAHSKGGLDTRYMISMLGGSPYVASLTTINTPHRGCEFADYLLGKASQKLRDHVSSAYNAAAAKLGDPNPDFIAAVTDLTASRCAQLNQIMSGFDMHAAGIFTQSFGTRMAGPSGGRFPLNMSYLLVNAFDGPNDGLVGKGSFAWGDQFFFIEPTTSRGISHGDMIDLNRENIPGFDVREFYVQLASDLKRRGL